MEVETHYANSGGVSIAYQVHGDGPVDLVLVPGFVSHVELLAEDPTTARFFRRLTAFSRLLVFDKRGQGLSDRPGRPPTLEESMDDLRAAIEAAGFDRPALLGISEGGPMSALCAATYPGEISALILFGTFARMVETDGFPTGSATNSSTGGDRWFVATGAVQSPSTSGRRAGLATVSSNAGGRACCGRGPARRGRSP